MNMFRHIIDSKQYMRDHVVYNISEKFGRGTIKSYDVMSGVELTYNDFEIYKPLSEKFKISVESLEINYCLEGCLESELPNSKIVYMGGGDISIFGYRTGVVLADFTTKHYKGLTVMLYLNEATKSIGNMLGVSELEIKKMINSSFNSDTCIVNHGNQSLDHIFKELYALPDKFKDKFIRIKVVELLLYILSNSDYKTKEKTYFPKSIVDKIKDARRILVTNIDSHITIKQLSYMVGINATDLQKGFKEIYQSSIYAYVKSYRMKKSKELLIKEDLSISDVANLVGYINNSKFSKAFKTEFGMTPSEYKISSRTGLANK